MMRHGEFSPKGLDARPKGRSLGCGVDGLIILEGPNRPAMGEQQRVTTKFVALSKHRVPQVSGFWRRSLRAEITAGICESRNGVQASCCKGAICRNECLSWVKRCGASQARRRSLSAFDPIDGVIGRQLVDSRRFWVLRFRLMVKRGPWLRPQASEGEAQHGPFCGTGRFGQGDQRLHCG